MFIQVLQGQVHDEAALGRQFDRWLQELAPQADGWQGTTAGLPTQGGFIAVVRFASEEAARRNSDRPEQDRWWTETAKSLGEVTFHDCPEVDTFGAGGSDQAGFVQVIQGRATDPERLRQLNAESGDQLRVMRPDIIGGTVAWHGDGGFTQTVYFTSEAEAREGERREMPEDQRGGSAEWQTMIVDARYFDLLDPWLQSP